METTMKIESREHEGFTIFDLDGDFDSRTAGDAKEEIRKVILGGKYNVIINLENVMYIDSAGLGTLVSALKTAKEMGGNVWLAGLTAQVKMVIELTRLHQVFNVYDSVDKALEALVGNPAPEDSR
ncbi:MAG: STAS domain-containing protein [bacterium]|nr:STAS domain-containing protein [bacterium]